jgi:hypothetical protein
MNKCDNCLKPIFYALRETDRGRLAIDMVPILAGDVVISDRGHGGIFFKVTNQNDPDAIYKRHVCARGAE